MSYFIDGKNIAISRKPTPIAAMMRMPGSTGPRKPKLMIKVNAMPRGINPASVTQIHPEDGRGLKVFVSMFDVVIVLSRLKQE
jgi:hypothetical protein